MVFLSLHIKEFGINSFITHLQESWWIDIVVNLCQRLFKPFRRSGSYCLFQVLQLFHVREVFGILSHHRYAP